MLDIERDEGFDRSVPFEPLKTKLDLLNEYLGGRTEGFSPEQLAEFEVAARDMRESLKGGFIPDEHRDFFLSRTRTGHVTQQVSRKLPPPG